MGFGLIWRFVAVLVCVCFGAFWVIVVYCGCLCCVLRCGLGVLWFGCLGLWLFMLSVCSSWVGGVVVCGCLVCVVVAGFGGLA